MSVSIETLSAEQFRAYRRTHQIDFDRERGVAWLPCEGGKLCCIDRVSLWNHSAGGPDDVRVVVADSEAEAVRELERIRPR